MWGLGHGPNGPTIKTNEVEVESDRCRCIVCNYIFTLLVFFFPHHFDSFHHPPPSEVGFQFCSPRKKRKRWRKWLFSDHYCVLSAPDLTASPASDTGVYCKVTTRPLGISPIYRRLVLLSQILLREFLMVLLLICCNCNFFFVFL